MRKLRNRHLPLIEATTDHPKTKEFARIGELLENHHSIQVNDNHFNLYNSLVHFRTIYRLGEDGETILFLEELQSDLCMNIKYSTRCYNLGSTDIS